MRLRPSLWLAAAGALVFAVLIPAAASAQNPGNEAASTRVQLEAPQEASLGDTPVIRARLTTADGQPVKDALVTFFSPVALGETSGEMEIGTARTDATGSASLEYQMRRSGTVTIIARFDGSAGYAASTATASLSVVGEKQLYTPDVGLSIPVLGSWLLVMVLAVVWGLYFLVAGRVLAIARSGAVAPVLAAADSDPSGQSRRQFLTRWMVPMGMHAAVASLGAGLATVILRAPDTHAHLRRFSSRSKYRRTPFVLVGQEEAMRQMPPLLDREVSFSQEVLPLFRAKAGPHFFQPGNSPPPGGIRLDGYDRIMARSHLVVPGKPEESELVQVLLAEAMRMPPAGNPLSDAEIQIISSWIAQGARNT